VKGVRDLQTKPVWAVWKKKLSEGELGVRSCLKKNGGKERRNQFGKVNVLSAAKTGGGGKKGVGEKVAARVTLRETSVGMSHTAMGRGKVVVEKKTPNVTGILGRAKGILPGNLTGR